MATDELRLDRYLSYVWRAKWIVLAGAILAAGIAAWNANRQPVLYSAIANLQVGRVWKAPIDDPNVAAEIVNSDGFADQLAGKIGASRGHIKHSIHADAVTAGPPRAQYTILVRITARTESADDSVKLAKGAADHLLALHEKVFDEALAPHLDHQKRLEARRDELSKQGASSAEMLLRIERELDDVRASNTSPTETEKTRLISDVSKGKVERPEVLRSAATAALIVALFLIAAALIAGYFLDSRVETEQATQQSDVEGA